MGCWTETCGISNLPISYGEKTMMILLDISSNGNLNHHCFINADVISLPIEGTYNDYGSLENIKRTQVVLDLEKKYGRNIDKLIDIITGHGYGHDENAILAYKHIKYMFVHKKIYDELTKLWTTEEDSNSIYDHGDLTEPVLKELGFKFIRKDLKCERYNRLYQSPDFKGLYIWSDGTWIRCTYGLETLETPYCIKHFEAILRKTGFKVNWSIYKFAHKSQFLMMEDKVNIENFFSLSQKQRFYKELPLNARFQGGSSVVAAIKNPLCHLHKESFLNGKIDKEVMEWIDFTYTIATMGAQFRPLEPTGSQDPWFEISHRVGKVICEVCEEKERERGQ